MKVSDITVDYLDHMGSDLTVVQSARVSFNKFAEVKVEHDGQEFTEILPVSKDSRDPSKWDEERDPKLIKYLAEHNHWSPFAHAFLQVRIKAPIFVARQLVKHQVGLAWNEVSRRYVDSEPEYYLPELRKRAENVKQGSQDEAVEILADYDGVKIESVLLCERMIALCDQFYDALLKSGVAPECARDFLPLTTMTQWIWSGSLYAFARVCNLRLDKHAQKETRLVAEQIFKLLETYFPVSTKALINVGD